MMSPVHTPTNIDWDEGQPLLAPPTPTPLQNRGDGESALEKRKRRRAMCFLPVIVVTYFIAYIVCHVEAGPYIYNKIASEYNGSHMSSEKPCAPNMSSLHNSTDQKIQNEIQKRVANLEMFLGMTTFLVAILPVVILGPLTDRLGRKVGFLFPIVGTFLKCIMYGFIIGLDLPLGLLFIAHMFEALGGAFAAMLSAMFSVISDVTVPGKQRAYFITSMEAMQTLVASFTQIGVAFWKNTSFEQPLYLAMASGLVSFTTAMCFPETHHAPILRSPGAGLSVSHNARSCAHFLWECVAMSRRSFSLYVRDSGGRVVKRRLALCVFILAVAVNFSRGGPWTLYRMKFPLCWSATYILVFNGVQMVVNWVVILLVMWLFRSVFCMADIHIALLGCVSSLLTSIFDSMAVNTTMVYQAAALGMLVRAIIPMLRSIMSSQVDSNNQGALYAGMGVIETFGAGMFGLVANKLYTATLDIFPGAVFLLFAGLTLISIVLLSVLHAIERRQARDEVDTPQPYQAIN